MPDQPFSATRPTRRGLLSLAGASLLAGIVAAPLLPARASDGENGDPSAAATDLIHRYQDALLDVMRRAEALSAVERADVLDEAVRATFDFDRMARAAVGRAWRDADADTQERMAEAFAAYSVAVHADRFDGHSGESFHIDGTAPGPAGTLLVNTHIDRPSKAPVILSYVVTQSGDGPRVVDVLMDGSISEVALRRSEWAAIREREGLSGLIAALKALTGRMLDAA
ncbi:ABC transporter substrate-binding protein [Rhodospira trueperi]|uniref:Phospholipid transport system substrate-binding protein n=1 Tax=Rhodospira trueperi TaxID=69960 RepID=A0A1G6YQW5_9PROT|nr:ABC transporter substrate-binding protein [Rhodospira trueperi]SDD92045.1 phospholipid transport system substrate-binding protein [Rhodospira trueperi]